MIITYDNVKTNIDFIVDDYFKLISNFNKYCLSDNILNNLNIWYDVNNDKLYDEYGYTESCREKRKA